MICLTRERLARNWSSAELARRADLNASTVSQIERGRFRPYAVQLAKLARALPAYRDDPERLLEELGPDGGLD